MSSQIKVLSKLDSSKPCPQVESVCNEETESSDELKYSKLDVMLGFHQLKQASEAETFKLIDDKEWNLTSKVPHSEKTFFDDGHSAMSIISVIGLQGVGKSTLLNTIAGKEAFKTHKSTSISNESNEGKLNVRHVTRGVDIHSTHHRILLDCQPLLSSSVLEDFLTGHSSSLPNQKNAQTVDAMTNCHMISLKLTTFLIATSDYVIIMSNWLIDIDLLKLIGTAIMMIGEDKLRAKLIVYSKDKKVHDKRFKQMIDCCLGRNRIDKYFDDDEELIKYIAPYSSEKCDFYRNMPSTFSGRNWLSSCQVMWDSKIRNSSMFDSYSTQLSYANGATINI